SRLIDRFSDPKADVACSASRYTHRRTSAASEGGIKDAYADRFGCRTGRACFNILRACPGVAKRLETTVDPERRDHFRTLYSRQGVTDPHASRGWRVSLAIEGARYARERRRFQGDSDQSARYRREQRAVGRYHLARPCLRCLGMCGWIIVAQGSLIRAGIWESSDADSVFRPAEPCALIDSFGSRWRDCPNTGGCSEPQQSI